MRSDTVRGLVSGLVAGIVFGILMQFVHATTPAGSRILLMEAIADMSGTRSLILGWAYHLFDTAIIGAIFGAILGARVRNYKNGFRYGAIFGFAWWLLGGLILGPFFLAMSVFSPQTIHPMSALAFPSLIGHVLFGAILGGVFVALRGKIGRPGVREIRSEEPGPIRRAQ